MQSYIQNIQLGILPQYNFGEQPLIQNKSDSISI